MSNLSELLPTGGGQNAVDFVASGTLSSGQTVALKADGTVEAVGESVIPESVSSATTIISGVYNPQRLYYDAVHDCFFYIYKDSANSYYLSAKVGTLSGTTISWGTTIVLVSGITTPDDAYSGCMDLNAEMFVIHYQAGTNNQSYARIIYNINASAKTFSLTNAQSISGNSINSNSPWVIYHKAQQRIIFGYNRSNVGYAKSALIDVSGPSWAVVASETGYSGGATMVWPTANYDEASETIVVCGEGSGLKVVAGSVNGNSLSFGSVVTVSGNPHSQTISYDSVAAKSVICYVNQNNSNYGTAVVVSISGTTVSLSPLVVFQSSSVSTNVDSMASVYSTISQTIVAFNTPNDGSAVKAHNGTVTGSSISFGSAFSMVNQSSDRYVEAAYSTVDGKIAFIDTNFTGSFNSIYQVYHASYYSTNSASFIGITSESIANTATGAVNVYGGINEAQTGLTIGSDYYVQADGSLSTTAAAVKVGQAISATTINMMDLT